MQISPTLEASPTHVMPGDVIVADDDGAIVVPVKFAEQALRIASEHAEWEEWRAAQSAQGQ